MEATRVEPAGMKAAGVMATGVEAARVEATGMEATEAAGVMHSAPSKMHTARPRMVLCGGRGNRC
jgi:hypothetical protein